MKICQPLSASILAVTILAATTAIHSGAADEEIDTAPAMAATQSWLASVDAGNYGQSWQDGAKNFRDAVTRETWESMVTPVRKQTGALVARKVRSAIYTRKLPNAPDGEYVVIQFDARFERVPHAVETVTSIKETDGSWRVGGYLVNPN